MRLSNVIPWQAKLSAKLVLSRLGVPYPAWRRLGIFRHGAMEDPAYALSIIANHLNCVKTHGFDIRGRTLLELGPGDTLATGLIAKALGADRSLLVDSDAYARTDLYAYAHLLNHLRDSGLLTEAPRLQSVHQLLQDYSVTYLTDGLNSLRRIPSATVDLVVSQAVLEHLRWREFDEIQAELLRVLRPNGLASHVVDLKDHLGGKLNNLRFSSELWERDWMAKSGFYTNRIRHHDMIRRFAMVGFDVVTQAVERWNTLPIERNKLHEAFRDLPDDDLNVKGFHVILRPGSVAVS